MVRIEGGTQALQRTVNATLSIVDDGPTTLSTPSVFGALVLKAAAYTSDSRDPQRHLVDATILLACLVDPYEAVEQFKGSDRSRMLVLARDLPDDASEWRLLDRTRARDARAPRAAGTETSAMTTMKAARTNQPVSPRPTQR